MDPKGQIQWNLNNNAIIQKALEHVFKMEVILSRSRSVNTVYP